MKQTTHQAFKSMINIRGIHNELDVSSSTVRGVRKKINDHALDDPLKWGISLDLMHAWLEKAGYNKISETLWKRGESGR